MRIDRSSVRMRCETCLNVLVTFRRGRLLPFPLDESSGVAQRKTVIGGPRALMSHLCNP